MSESNDQMAILIEDANKLEAENNKLKSIIIKILQVILEIENLEQKEA